jgi:hypothetical protein
MENYNAKYHETLSCLHATLPTRVSLLLFLVITLSCSLKYVKTKNQTGSINPTTGELESPYNFGDHLLLPDIMKHKKQNEY